MTIRRTLSPRLRLLALLLAISLAGLAAGAVTANAVDGCKANCATTTYYSDAFHHQVVGIFTADVCGNCTGSGQITNFYFVHQFICTDIACT